MIKTKTCLTFKSWLRRHADDGDQLGEFARAVLNDPCWPSGGPRQTIKHLIRLGAGCDVLDAHDQAWHEYRNYRFSARPCLRTKLVRRVGREDARALAVDAAFMSGDSTFADDFLQRTVAQIEVEIFFGVQKRRW